jgi:hypothetical protein
MTAFKVAIRLRSSGECCSNARAGAKFAENRRGSAVSFQLWLDVREMPVDPISIGRVSNVAWRALTGFNRLARCSMMPASGG